MTEAEHLLDWFIRRLIIRPFEMGGKVVMDKHGETKLSLMFVINEEPMRTYGLAIEGNSYDAACLGELGSALNAARRLLGKTEIPIEPSAFFVQQVTP
jgi:hypothetical protein